MAYIAASTAVDGRGKILLGPRATELFDLPALKGFLGHEMAHLVSDNTAAGCNDYILRDPRSKLIPCISGANARNTTRQRILAAGAGSHRGPEWGRKTPTRSAAMISAD